MRVIEGKQRKRMPARPRINVRTECEPEGETWYCRAVMRAKDLPEEPKDGLSDEYLDWQNSILDIVAEVTGWALQATPLAAYSPTGRPYSNMPNVYRHGFHPGVVIVSWSGGLDI